MKPQHVVDGYMLKYFQDSQRLSFTFRFCFVFAKATHSLLNSELFFDWLRHW